MPQIRWTFGVTMKRLCLSCLAALLLLMGQTAQAGPPYLSDDPEPTDYGHYEIYAFGDGTQTSAGWAGEGGIDFNYGGAPDLQLTAVLPLAYDETGRRGLGNVELAAKYRFLHQDYAGWDVSVFPRVFLPSATRGLGDDHVALLLPFWAQKDFGAWSLFGGGGCTLQAGGDVCEGGAALTREIAPGFRLGTELYYVAPAPGQKASTVLGLGASYDVSATYHLLAWWGPGLQNLNDAGRQSLYAALLFTL
jgi:hypothetical protein